MSQVVEEVLSESEARAKNIWLLSFGDVVTLLISFFILLIAVNKGEITKIQKWSDEQVEHSFYYLQQQVERKGLPISLSYSLEGIKLVLHADQSFKKGDYHPLPQLVQTLSEVADLLKSLPLLQLRQNPETQKIIQAIESKGYRWILEVNVEGHTDNDAVDPRSPVRNNWILSALRAQTVAELLAQSSQLPQDIFIASGFSEYRPVVENLSPAQKALNRRVEITVLGYFQKL